MAEVVGWGSSPTACISSTRPLSVSCLEGRDRLFLARPLASRTVSKSNDLPITAAALSNSPPSSPDRSRRPCRRSRTPPGSDQASSPAARVPFAIAARYSPTKSGNPSVSSYRRCPRPSVPPTTDPTSSSTAALSRRPNRSSVAARPSVTSPRRRLGTCSPRQVSHDAQLSPGSEAPHEVSQQVERRGVGPVHVVDKQHAW